MKRVLVLGCPGSGKSTFSRKLRDKTGLPLYHLDLFYHNADKTTVDSEVFDKRLARVLGLDEYIIDGNYLRTLEARLGFCDTVFLFDLPLEVCLKGIESRIGLARDDMPWVEEEFDKEFRSYVMDFPEKQLPQVKRLLNKATHVKTMVFKSHEEADRYLKEESHGD